MLNSTPDSLGALLGGCLAASVLAGDVIRAVVADGVDLAVVNKADGAYDPQTVADRRAQQRMVFALRRAFPKLRIVGEEGELAAPAAEDRVECGSAASALPALPDTPVDWESLVVWMDPLDGTKRFAAGKFDEVSVLLGITVDQRPVAGVVHLPFLGKHGTTFWGGPGIGVFRSVHGATAAEVEHAPYAAPTTGFPRRALTVTVSSTNCDLVNAALRQLAPGTVLTGGATGTMVLGVITGISDAFFRFKAATRKWDICAVEALLLGLGGALVDASGKPYRYDPDDEDQTFDNPTGLLACLEPRLLASMLAAMAEVKLTRALDDREMDADWLNEHAGLHREVESVRVVSGSVRRGKHSHVATLEVQFRGSNDQHRLFLKRSVRSELPPRSETHWTRDLASYRTEARFYAEFYPSIVAASVPLVPVRFTAHSADQFLLLLDHADCSGLACVDRLDVHHAQLALRYLASLHAAACQVDGLLDRAAERLWPTGGWWELAKRGQQELEQATTVWPLVLASFGRELTAAGIDTQSERIVNLGARMVQHAGYVHRQLVSDTVGPKTLVHGDFKAANLLFGASGVTAFDWQWTGVGLGAMDVAYLLNTSVGIEALEDEHELIRVYYEALDERVGLQQYPLAAFERHCRLAALEYGRILLSNFWKGMTPQSCAAKAANANCGLGYRSVAHVVRMVRVLDAGLAFVEHEQQQQQL